MFCLDFNLFVRLHFIQEKLLYCKGVLFKMGIYNLFQRKKGIDLEK